MTLDLDGLRTGLAALATRPDEVAPEHLPGLVADLARAQAALLTAASRPSTVVHREPERPEPDRMLDVEEAAAMLGVTKRWVYRHVKDLPFARRLSRKTVRFSRFGLVRHLGTRRL